MFLRLSAFVLGLLAVPALAASSAADAPHAAANVAVLQAPPPVIFVAAGVAMVLVVIGRRVRRGFSPEAR
ncbi:MAG: hypothetical protein H6825_05455 [Planctomycetes bacterium]|nr:hypothetical protein [Planctomycetota bacterium]